MKIGVDIRALMDERYSGVSAYAEQLLKELLRQDQENEYYLFYNSFRNLSARFSSFENERVKVVGTHFPNKIFNYGVVLFWRNISIHCLCNRNDTNIYMDYKGVISWIYY